MLMVASSGQCDGSLESSDEEECALPLETQELDSNASSAAEWPGGLGEPPSFPCQDLMGKQNQRVI